MLARLIARLSAAAWTVAGVVMRATVRFAHVSNPGMLAVLCVTMFAAAQQWCVKIRRRP